MLWNVSLLLIEDRTQKDRLITRVTVLQALISEIITCYKGVGTVVGAGRLKKIHYGNTFREDDHDNFLAHICKKIKDVK